MHMVVVAYGTLNRRCRNTVQWPHTQTLMRESRDINTFEDITYNMTCMLKQAYTSQMTSGHPCKMCMKDMFSESQLPDIVLAICAYKR
jgi:hypothetical protein